MYCDKISVMCVDIDEVQVTFNLSRRNLLVRDDVDETRIMVEGEGNENGSCGRFGSVLY